jgi:PAS domain S-box-containing protein
MVHIYGPERSFNRKDGDVVSAVSIRAPLQAAYAQANRFSLQLSAILVGTVFVGFLIISYFTRRVLLEPLALIRDKAVAIANSDKRLGEQITQPYGKELMELAVAFNDMSVSLKEGRDHLEERIAQRTADLAGANTELETEVTERKRAEAQFQKAHERLSETLESISDGFLVLDEEMVVTYFNKAAERQLRRKREEVLNRKLFEVFPQVEDSIFKDYYFKAINERRNSAFEINFGPESNLVWFHVSLYPFEHGVSVYFRETTKKKRAEERTT